MLRDVSRRRGRRTVGGLKQLPWRRLRNPYRPIEVLSEDQLEAIHNTSLRILEEHGMEFLDGLDLDEPDQGSRSATTDA
jgi:trimethylamine--corrinoid protein Co-methyltransferase